MSAEKLFRMAGQIASFMRARDGEAAPAGIAAHINDYWAPSMRRQFLEQVARNPDSVDPLLRAAAPLIRPAPSEA